MTTVSVIIGIIALIIIIAKVRAGVRKNTAAMNALVAKHIFEQMPDAKRAMVLDAIAKILQRDLGWSYEKAKQDVVTLNEPALFGWAALAMAEMGINPEQSVWRWQVVRNPYVALVGADKAIYMAKVGLQNKGINVSF